MLKEAQQMAREAGVDLSMKSPPPPSNEAAEKLSAFPTGDASVPVPNTAEDVEFDGSDGRLEFNTSSSVKSVAEFYRATMKQQGWASQPTVINNANMVVLDFSKGGKSVNFTIMKMGPKTNVSANSAGLKVASAKAPDKTESKPAADTPSEAATEEDLVVEESGPIAARMANSDGGRGAREQKVRDVAARDQENERNGDRQ